MAIVHFLKLAALLIKFLAAPVIIICSRNIFKLRKQRERLIEEFKIAERDVTIAENESKKGIVLNYMKAKWEKNRKDRSIDDNAKLSDYNQDLIIYGSIALAGTELFNAFADVILKLIN